MSRINCKVIWVFCNIQEFLQSTQNQLSIATIKTLTIITSKVSTLNWACFMRSVFITVKENQKQYVIMQDKIYWKKCCYIMGELCLEERLMIVNPLQKLYYELWYLACLLDPYLFGKCSPLKNWILHFFMNK